MANMRFEKCPQCGGTLATQMDDGEIRRYDDDHAHINGAPSSFGLPIRSGGRGR